MDCFDGHQLEEKNMSSAHRASFPGSLMRGDMEIMLAFLFPGCRETHPDSSLPPGSRSSLLPPWCRRDTSQLVLHLSFF